MLEKDLLNKMGEVKAEIQGLQLWGDCDLELASLLRVSAAFVSELELGTSAPSERTLKKIGEIFFIDARKLEKVLIRFREERRKEVKRKLGLRMSRK